MPKKEKCVGYCLLSKEKIPLALTKEGKLVCFVGGGPGQTTEDGVLITKDEVYTVRELTKEEKKWVLERQKEFRESLDKQQISN